ncbi:MAG: hypothetical protein C4308_00105 [Chitinophagaceae bacterium]
MIERVLFNEFLPYDCSSRTGHFSTFDKKLIQFSIVFELVVFLADGTSGTYDFSFWKEGQTVRRWAADEGGVLCDEEDLLQPETDFVVGTHQSSYDSGQVQQELFLFLKVSWKMIFRSSLLKKKIFLRF